MSKRTPALPDVPTARESGLPTLVVSSWNALAAPAKTPKAVIARLNQDVVAALQAPDVQKKLLDLNVEARPSTPEQAAQLLASEIQRWGECDSQRQGPQAVDHHNAPVHHHPRKPAMQLEHIGMVGYGEVGKIFAAGLKSQVARGQAWDLKLRRRHRIRRDPRRRAGPRRAGRCAGLPSMQALCENADCIISAVTASNTLAVAQEAARHLRPGTVFLDLNSASPGTKQQAAAVIDAAGGHYVEAGVMTSVPPYGIRVPMLLGGARAAALAETLCGLGHGRQGRCRPTSAWPRPSRCAAA